MHDDLSTNQQTLAKPYPRTCAECGEVAVQPTEITYDAQVKHDGRTHRFQIPRLIIDKCQRCGEELFTSRTNDQITAALREFLGLLQPADIRRRLVELGLTQRSFAKRIGVAPETVSRWLNSLAIQTRALDNLMRLFLGQHEVRALLATDGPPRNLDLSEGVSATCHAPGTRVLAGPCAKMTDSRIPQQTDIPARFARPFGPAVLARRATFQLVVSDN